jgi:hypothetical protein
MDKNTIRKEVSLPDLIEKIEGILDTEIDSLSETLESVAPEKRLDFISKLLPLVIKYREDNKSLGDWI